MVGWFSKLLYGSTPSEFVSDFSLTESVDRLSKIVSPTVFHSLFRESAVGFVSESQVRLERSIPFVSNSFKPYFIGSFQDNDGQVVLVGKFTMHIFTKAFATFWFGFCILWTLLVCTAFFGEKPQMGFMFIAGIGMFGLGCSFVRIAKWFSRNDEEWLSNVIRIALTQNED